MMRQFVMLLIAIENIKLTELYKDKKAYGTSYPTDHIQQVLIQIRISESIIKHLKEVLK